MVGAPNFLLVEKNGSGSRTLFEGDDLGEVRDFIDLKEGDGESWVDDLHPYLRGEG